MEVMDGVVQRNLDDTVCAAAGMTIWPVLFDNLKPETDMLSEFCDRRKVQRDERALETEGVGGGV